MIGICSKSAPSSGKKDPVWPQQPANGKALWAPWPRVGKGKTGRTEAGDLSFLGAAGKRWGCAATSKEIGSDWEVWEWVQWGQSSGHRMSRPAAWEFYQVGKERNGELGLAQMEMSFANKGDRHVTNHKGWVQDNHLRHLVFLICFWYLFDVWTYNYKCHKEKTL